MIQRESRRVVVTDYDYPSMELEHAVINGAGFELIPLHLRSAEEIVSACRDAEVVLNQYAPLTESVFAELPHLRAVVRYGVGIDHIDLAAATRHGVVICNVPDYGVEEVSDHALSLVLSLLRRIVLLDRLVRRGVWDVSLAGAVPRFSGVSLGIVGLGRIGSSMARKAGALGMRVLAHDPLLPEANFRALAAERLSLRSLLERADAVSVHVPLTSETRHLIGRPELALLRPSAVLVNTSRGPVVDEIALADALRQGLLAGAAVDVLEHEPPSPDHPLLGLDNVILTPHAAWYSAESAITLKRLAAEEVVRILRGEPPRCPLNPEAWDMDRRSASG